MNSKLTGTTMSKISCEGVVALKRAGLVSTFQTVYSARLLLCLGCSKRRDQTGSFQSPHYFKTVYSWLYLQVYYSYLYV